ncbi:MAG: tryptophan synthase subunit beta [Pseudobdellovibrionaceae bacterium]
MDLKEQWSVDQTNKNGRYGLFGGRYVPDTLFAPLQELAEAFESCVHDEKFLQELNQQWQNFVGRPTALTWASRLTEHLGGAQIYLKREDLAHTGAHKINNSMGQILLAKKMGKTRIIAETGAGQHGVATATVAAKMGLQCVIYMGAVDMERQALNVYRMRLLGAEVRAVNYGQKTLKDATSEAMRDWVTNIHNSYYLIGSALGPHPYPAIVSFFQQVIGREARQQLLAQTQKNPDVVVACVGGGSNAIGIFTEFLADEKIQLVGVEAGGESITPGLHAARFSGGVPGVLQGTYTYVLQDGAGQTLLTHSISAGLDYPAVGPMHADFFQSGRVRYTSASDQEALQAFHLLCKIEGIIPALESSHALAEVIKLAPTLSKDKILLVNLSGRGDKDIGIIQSYEKLAKTEGATHA